MAIVVGHYLKSGLLLESVEIAMRQLEKIIYANVHDIDKDKGIPIEQFLEEINDEKA